MCNVAWCTFSWDAFATLVTGLLAVGAAVWVALKQMAITDRQVELEALKLRADLYDRRMEIYSAVREWFAAFLRDGEVPTGELKERFMQAVYTSEFLFRAEVSNRLRQIYGMGFQHLAHRRAGRAEQELAVSQELIAASNELNELFGPEMRIGPAL